jgi:hypothetical protein
MCFQFSEAVSFQFPERLMSFQVSANVLPIFREAKSILERPNQFKRTKIVEVKTSI